jgi:mono/diheme cytochrome c family protein
LFRLAIAGILSAAAVLAATPEAQTVTFNRDILPIMQKNCQSCHRPGEIAPFSLVSYNDARPWAKSIKAAVVSRKMPPWFADPSYGHFANDMRLSEADIKTIVSWVDAGASEGDARDKPAPIAFQDGWNLKPDMVVKMPKPFDLPAKGTINYKFIRVKGDFPEDVWVSAAEMRPGNRKVVHHGKVWVLPPGSHWMEKAVYGEAYDKETQAEIIGHSEAADDTDILGKFNPGLGAQTFDIGGSAKLIPKGSDFVFELHYTASGEATTDVSALGIVKAKTVPETRYFLSGAPLARNLVIPPGDPNAEVVSEATVTADNVSLVYIQPHMHLRGKDFEVRLAYPTGETQTVFKGKWDFNWQQGFTCAKPIVMPKGTRIIAISHFDNSLNNPYNPDPTKEVFWGDQNWDEMSNAFIGILFPRLTPQQSVLKSSGPSLLKPVPGQAGPTLATLAQK